VIDRKYLDARNEEIKKFRRNGLTLAAIGKKYGITREAIRLVCKGIPKPDLKKYYKKKCVSCGESFTVSSEQKSKKTCSKKCFSKIQERNNYKNGEWTKKLVDLECAECGKKFQRTKRLISIARHSYAARDMDYSEKKWYCGTKCNLKDVRRNRYGDKEE
tara:strand:- start:438 stop:917 length:480 start_codon:yes stop_codon:yes gene_type:complete